jgi:hypothetical protein
MPPCEGRLVRCHLIARQELERHPVFAGLDVIAAHNFVYDSRVWVWGCGGITGLSGHHGAFDYARSIRLPRLSLPEGLEQLAGELELEWYLDRVYGPRRDSICTAP